jgi:hypothetical protein
MPRRRSNGRWTVLAALVLALGLLAAAVAAPAQRTHAQRIVTSPLVMFAVADTEITQPPSRIDPPILPSEPRGSAPRLRAGWNHLAGDHRSLLRFELPPIDEDVQVVQAELELLLWSASVDAYSPPIPESGTMRLSISALDAVWAESDTLADLSFLPRRADPEWTYEQAWGPCAARTCGRMHLDITELVQRWRADPGSNHGLVLDAVAMTDTAHFGAQIEFGSRESSMPARLVVEVAGAGAGGTDPIRDPRESIYLPWGAQSR